MHSRWPFALSLHSYKQTIPTVIMVASNWEKSTLLCFSQCYKIRNEIQHLVEQLKYQSSSFSNCSQTNSFRKICFLGRSQLVLDLKMFEKSLLHVLFHKEETKKQKGLLPEIHMSLEIFLLFAAFEMFSACGSST